MARLLVVHHSPTRSTRALLDAALAGARHPDLDGVDVHVVPALEASADDVLADLDTLLVTLEESLTRAGATVHWARDAVEANRIALEIARAKEVDEVVKVKSMATQEIELNEALEARGISAWETDLAELIVQLGHDLPSHILVPAIHRNRTEIRDIFTREMGQVGRPAPDDLTDDPAALAEGVLAGNRRAVARAITLVESMRPDRREPARQMLRQLAHATEQ